MCIHIVEVRPVDAEKRGHVLVASELLQFHGQLMVVQELVHLVLELLSVRHFYLYVAFGLDIVCGLVEQLGVFYPGPLHKGLEGLENPVDIECHVPYKVSYARTLECCGICVDNLLLCVSLVEVLQEIFIFPLYLLDEGNPFLVLLLVRILPSGLLCFLVIVKIYGIKEGPCGFRLIAEFFLAASFQHILEVKRRNLLAFLLCCIELVHKRLQFFDICLDLLDIFVESLRAELFREGEFPEIEVIEFRELDAEVLYVLGY